MVEGIHQTVVTPAMTIVVIGGFAEGEVNFLGLFAIVWSDENIATRSAFEVVPSGKFSFGAMDSQVSAIVKSGHGKTGGGATFEEEIDHLVIHSVVVTAVNTASPVAGNGVRVVIVTICAVC